MRLWIGAALLALARTPSAMVIDGATPSADSALLELLNVTSVDEIFALDESQWTSEARDAMLRQIRDTIPDTVPAHVTCNKIKRCDKRKVCAIICEPGSVVVDPWLQKALKLQRKLAYRRNFCHTHLPGSHNSAINLADGYGIEDHVFEGYLQYLSWFKKGMEVHTNDQLFSLTDQMNMGVRFIELDVHWFNNDLHIAHCGGFHSGLLDEMINVLNKIAKWLGTNIEWDSETIGCKPSLSSIPADEQRRLNDALAEIATWFHKPENKDEFLLVFFDDETNLFRWKKVAKMIEYLKTHFVESEVLVPDDLVQTKGWPTFESLIEAGKRVVFMSGANYSPEADSVLFVKDEICNWTEPALPFLPYPDCQFTSDHIGPLDRHHTIFRPETSEIVYAFLNADGRVGGNTYILNETSIPPMVECGVNIPSPDNITPRRVETTIWTLPRPYELSPGKCVAMTRSESTWTSVDCDTQGFVAVCGETDHYDRWVLGGRPVLEHDAATSCAIVSKTMVYRAPTNGYENKLVHDLLQKAPPDIKGVWVNAKSLVHDVFSDQTQVDEADVKWEAVNDIVSVE